MRKVFPFLKSEYFANEELVVFNKISEFVNKYNTTPPIDAIEIACQNDKEIPENVYNDINDLLSELREKEASKSMEWLSDATEKFCQEKALYNAILQSIKIIDGKETKQLPDAIPSMLQEALAVCFNSSIGHDYLNDAEERYDFYNNVEERICFDIEYLNKITNGGIAKKTLTMLLAATGVGKSLVMCHMAANWLRQGLNVLYITLEMAEERIAERIDANLMNCDISQLKDLPKETFMGRVKKITDKTQGRLMIKEYPTSSAHVNHFRTLLNELELKQNFKPDVIFIDYLNICASSRYKPGPSVNSYTIVKSIAEEIRGLAVEFDVPIISATQTNRGGYGNTDVELTDTSESMGLPMSVDLMLAIISTEELEQLNQLLFKQLKNRYSDPSKYKRFVVGIDRPKMRLYDLEDTAQINIQDAGNQQQPMPSKFNGGSRPMNSSKFGDFKM